ncbi:MAG: hypothetical protein WCL56_02670 [Sediminibacterium sp.]|jgi:hypothetical protein
MIKRTLILVFFFTATQSLLANSNSFFLNKEINNSASLILAKADSMVLDNPYMTVMQNMAVCTAAHTVNFGTRVIAALGALTVKTSKGIITLQRGQVAVFLENETYQLPEGLYFEIAFKKNHPALSVPEQWVEPLKNTTVYEDDQFRIFEERLLPKDVRELHSHAQRLVVRLNKVQLTDPRFSKEVKEGTGIQVPNTVKFAEPIVHAVKNLSDIPLFNIVIEFKVPHTTN